MRKSRSPSPASGQQTVRLNNSKSGDHVISQTAANRQRPKTRADQPKDFSSRTNPCHSLSFLKGCPRLFRRLKAHGRHVSNDWEKQQRGRWEASVGWAKNIRAAETTLNCAIEIQGAVPYIETAEPIQALFWRRKTHVQLWNQNVDWLRIRFTLAR